MPEMWAQMGQAFATNPSGGFTTMLDHLATLEGPALEGVRLNRDEERQIGRQTRDQMLARLAAQGSPVVNDPEKVRYLRELVNGLARRMKNRDRYPKLDIVLVEQPIPDAHAFAGGWLLFTTGLLDEPDEATVAAVVAHELAHLDLGHVYGYARRTKLMEATYSAPAMGRFDLNTMMTRQAAMLGLMMHPYRPEHEFEADCRSATWLFQEGYDPEALAGFLDRMGRRQERQNNFGFAAPDNPMLQLLRSHPPSPRRAAAVRERRAQLVRWRPKAELGLYGAERRALKSRYSQLPVMDIRERKP
jgi:predicted Zn-dependent protease